MRVCAITRSSLSWGRPSPRSRTSPGRSSPRDTPRSLRAAARRDDAGGVQDDAGLTAGARFSAPRIPVSLVGHDASALEREKSLDESLRAQSAHHDITRASAALTLDACSSSSALDEDATDARFVLDARHGQRVLRAQRKHAEHAFDHVDEAEYVRALNLEAARGEEGTQPPTVGGRHPWACAR